MWLEMLASRDFRSEYCFVANAPYEHHDRALFLRREFLESNPRKAELTCIPVAETTLYSRGARR